MASSYPAVAGTGGDHPLQPANMNDVIVADTFPSKAFLVIEYCDTNNPDVACWSEDGSNFIVHDTVEFAASHLPRYFKHSNFQSFIRQLNLYGFRTIKQAVPPKVNGQNPVMFHHEFFQKGRGDLLEKIQRSKKGDRPKKSKSRRKMEEEEKKEEYASFNQRFDMMQEQLDQLSTKMDLLVTLMNTLITNSQTEVYVSHVGTKRHRVDDVSGKATMSVSDSSTTSQNSVPSHVGKSPRYVANNMGVLEEYKTFEGDDGSDIEVDCADYEPQKHDENYDGQETKEFQEFVEQMLEDSEGVEEVATGAMDVATDTSAMASSRTVTDPLRNKTAPATAEGTHVIPEATVSASAEAVTSFDEEAGTYEGDLPLTTAVEVTNAAVPERKRWSRTKVFVGVSVILVLIAFIVWPVVVFTNKDDDGKKKKKNPPRPPPRPIEQRPGYNRTGVERPQNNRTGVVDILQNRTKTTIFGRGNQKGGVTNPGNPAQRPLRRPGMALKSTIGDDYFTVNWKGEAYGCKSLF